MKLFSRLFSKPPPSPPKPQERIATLNAGPADLLTEKALSDKEENLRIAAIDKLPDGEALRGLAGFGTPIADTMIAHPPEVERAARARVARLIDEGAINFSAYCDSARNRPEMFAVAALCKDPGRLPQALASIRDPAQIAKLVVESPSSRLRQLAAESIRDPVQLRQLLPQVRNKDKSVYKILKQKCDALNAEDRKAEEIRNEIAASCAALERHSHRTYDSLYTSGFEHLKTRWHALTTPVAADIEQRAREAIRRCEQVIDTNLRQLAQRAAEDAARKAALELKELAREAARVGCRRAGRSAGRGAGTRAGRSGGNSQR